ncbi:MAG: NTP transferase domain-containing protein [Saprospiraceae bacterium]|jgi:glucose-1-phosphate thymidylyltransferase|nr:NTP transferase domain-containing protein [Saprospiraceae bacterium]
MKAIIPVAGAGIRLRPHTYTQPKPLIPVAGKPILAYIVDQLIEAGIRDFVFIIGYLGEQIRIYLEVAYPEVTKTYITQTDRLGSAHAIFKARETLQEEEECIVVFGDTIIDIDMDAFLQEPHSCLAVKKVKDPREVGVVETDSQGFAIKLIEKPGIPKSNLAMVGMYKIRQVKVLLAAIADLIEQNRRTHGEYQLTDALMEMIQVGVQFKTIEVRNWFDCGKKEILLETNAIMLKRQGAASIAYEGLENSIVIPPVYIGQNCSISHSIIGPNVSIGNDSRIDTCMVCDSIVGNFASLHDVVLHQSIIGNDSALNGPRQSLNIGDNTEIDFS